VDDHNPTLEYATPKRRKGWRSAIVVVALLFFALLAVAFYFWQFFIKPDLDKGIWP
jgi:type VI protein secretion system component VasF